MTWWGSLVRVQSRLPILLKPLIAPLALGLVACQTTVAPPGGEGHFRGRIAGAAIAQLKDDGFACWLEQRRHVPGLDIEQRRELLQTRPVLFCSKWDPTPGLACIERRYVFEVEWSDARALDAGLVDQLHTRRISRERYTCVPNA